MDCPLSPGSFIIELRVDLRMPGQSELVFVSCHGLGEACRVRDRKVKAGDRSEKVWQRLNAVMSMVLKTIDNPGISRLKKQIHEVEIPPLCPKTNNPIKGSILTITYAPKEKLLELYSLNEYTASFIGSKEVRDLELFTQVVARDCSAALGVKISVTGKFVLNIGQTLICECESE